MDEKIEHIKSVVMEEARSQGNAIMKQHQAVLDDIFKAHQEEANRQAKIRMKAETNAGRRTLKLAASKKQVALRRERSKVLYDLKNQLFDEVKELLFTYMQTEEYLEYLTEHMKQAARFAGSQAVTIYINPTDLDKKDYLEDFTGMSVTISKEDFIGGIRAVIREKNVLMDYSFQAALEEEYEKFTFKGGAGVE